MDDKKPVDRVLQQDRIDRNEHSQDAAGHNLPVAEQVDTVVFSLDEFGKLTDISQSWVQLLGFSQQESLHKPFSDFVVEVRSGPLGDKEAKSRLFSPLKHYQLSIAGKHGDLQWFDCTVTLDKDQTSGQLIALTEPRNLDSAEAQVLLQKDKEQFFAFLSHELRNELHGIVGLSELLINTSLNETQQVYTQLIQTGSQQLLKISNEILDYFKIQSPGFQLNESAVDLASSFESMMKPFAYQCEQKGLQFRQNFNKLPACVVCDINRVRQIFINLVQNSLKFTERGYITVGADCVPTEEEGRAELRCYVEDSGCGIPKEKQAHLYAAYSQAHAFDNSSGLGLAICKQLVGLMGGELRVNSEFGMGARFFFTLNVGAQC